MEMAQDAVRTRARAALAMEAASSAAQTPKRRKINNNNTTKQEREREEFVHHKTPPTPTAAAEVEEKRFISDDLPASCCSSNGSVGYDEIEERNDLEEVESTQVETSSCNCCEEETEIQRREMSHSTNNGENSKEMESSMEANSHRPPPSTATRRKPTAAELEEFFGPHEREMQQRFKEKYNFDIVKDVPLEGRYEWVQLKP